MTTDTMIREASREPAREPARARAVFSNEDFGLLRVAVMAHLQRPEIQNGPESIKYSNLFHRLGRLG